MSQVRQSVYARCGIHTTTLYYGNTNIDPALCIFRSEVQEPLLRIYGTVSHGSCFSICFANERYGMLHS